MMMSAKRLQKSLLGGGVQANSKEISHISTSDPLFQSRAMKRYKATSSTSEREEPHSLSSTHFIIRPTGIAALRQTSDDDRRGGKKTSTKKKRQLSPFTTSETHKNWIYVNSIMKAKLYRNINRRALVWEREGDRYLIEKKEKSLSIYILVFY